MFSREGIFFAHKKCIVSNYHWLVCPQLLWEPIPPFYLFSFGCNFYQTCKVSIKLVINVKHAKDFCNKYRTAENSVVFTYLYIFIHFLLLLHIFVKMVQVWSFYMHFVRHEFSRFYFIEGRISWLIQELGWLGMVMARLRYKGV